ncbi:unnamed protein product [Adineta steineri]|uniref:Clathrin light chain n=1 Tax=Adineta steineri TaxID=433720 RepID=A0A813N4Z6_9BILA|nr:unnamed protein product [Adineta steineri]CAF3477333.1 unnamed protein product [Adineta steineri]
MDEFDLLNQTSENKNTQEDDLFGSGNLDNTAPTNTFNTNQQEDLSWDIGNVSSNATTEQFDMLGGDILNNSSSVPQVSSFDGDMFTTQSSTDTLDSSSTTNSLSTSNNDRTEQQSDNSSFGMFSNPVSSTESVSPLQVYNTRRQQEITEKDVVEQRNIEELRKQAKTDLERWYQDRQKHMEQKRQTMKSEEELFRTKALEQSDKTSCDWSKVIRFLEFSQGTHLAKGKRDLNRMKSTIMNATRDRIKRTSENSA